jgi:hypothetical protein
LRTCVCPVEVATLCQLPSWQPPSPFQPDLISAITVVLYHRLSSKLKQTQEVVGIVVCTASWAWKANAERERCHASAASPLLCLATTARVRAYRRRQVRIEFVLAFVLPKESVAWTNPKAVRTKRTIAKSVSAISASRLATLCAAETHSISACVVANLLGRAMQPPRPSSTEHSQVAVWL